MRHSKPTCLEAYITDFTHNRQCSNQTLLISLNMDSARRIPHLLHSRPTVIEACVIQNRRGWKLTSLISLTTAVLEADSTQQSRCQKHTSRTSLITDSSRSRPHVSHSKSHLQSTVLEADLSRLTHNGQCLKHTSLTSPKVQSSQGMLHSKRTVLEAYITYLTHNRQCPKQTSPIPLKNDGTRSTL